MASDIYTQRRDNLRQKLKRNDLDAYLVLHPANRYYLSGFELHDPQCNESAGCLLLTATGEDYLFTDPRYQDVAARIWQGQDFFIYKQDRNQKLGQVLQQLELRKLGFESRIMNYETYSALKDQLHLEPYSGLVENLRSIKDEHEILSLQNSCALNHQILENVSQMIACPGISEQELAWEIEKLFRENGASELAFTPIVALGPNAALPHHLPGKQRLNFGKPLLVDTGARLQDYCSDQTRTFWLGEDPPGYFQETLQLVRQAQDLALKSIKPDLPAKEVYQDVYDFFCRHGVQEHFTHSLGHGIGLETHEAPSLGPKNQELLRPGMVVTIEPGLYYAHWGGVRWEYMVLVTETGARVL